MGRNAIPIDLLVANGKKHLTKAEIEIRKESEVKLGNSKLMCPSYIKNNVIAYKKWKEITKIYKEVDFVSSADAGLLARYCQSHSEYINLLETRTKLDNAEINWEKYEDILPEDFAESITKLLKLEPLLKIDSQINKKMDMLIKMEDRLFLNPLAKVKNIPKAESKKEDPVADRFGNL